MTPYNQADLSELLLNDSNLKLEQKSQTQNTTLLTAGKNSNTKSYQMIQKPRTSYSSSRTDAQKKSLNNLNSYRYKTRFSQNFINDSNDVSAIISNGDLSYSKDASLQYTQRENVLNRFVSRKVSQAVNGRHGGPHYPGFTPILTSRMPRSNHNLMQGHGAQNLLDGKLTVD